MLLINMQKQTYKVKNSIAATQGSNEYVACKQLTVITLTYNNFDQLEETLESVKSIRPKEVLVINGGQCTKTLDYLNSKPDYFKDYFQLRHLSEPDKGIYDGMNKGVKNATGQYVNFLNSGDRVCDPQYFKFAIDVLTSHSHIGYTHTDVVFGNEKQGYHKIPSKRSMLYLYIPKKTSKVMPWHQTMVYRLGIFSEVGLFNTKYKIAGDWDHNIRMYKKNIKPYYLDFLSIVFDDGGISASNPFSTLLEVIKCFKINKILFLNLKYLSHFLYYYISQKMNQKMMLFFNATKTLLLLGAKNIKYEEEQTTDVDTLLRKKDKLDQLGNIN